MAGDEKLRIDKWLWQARFFKSRSLSAACVTGGHLRINGQRTVKASHGVGPGDVLTFSQGQVVRVIRVEALGTRRGPAPEAQALYFDLDPPQDKAPADPPPIARMEGNARPTKRDRRKLQQIRKTEID
ncbi:RNA-binding S4 domain-containing protein [Pseudooceanicola aestuarii]|uniref:RNA-binding S4 domain-containing protein n=1 Tax=Pseudooceanicola aestuarii TaxID=2697319 RepID=UPI0013D55CBA|nr:RNA-binding S4 domain-containing protein [Pseudooceanicola aestuarii]